MGATFLENEKSEFSGGLCFGRGIFSRGALVIFLELFFCNMAIVFSVHLELNV